MIKKLICIMLIGVLVVISTFIACENSVAKKSMEQAKVSIENRDYAQALSLLEITLNENPKNEEAKKLYDIVQAYEKSNKAYEDNNIEEAKKILDNINEEYENYPIKKDIDDLKHKVKDVGKEIEKVNNYLKEAENLYNNKKYRDCKIFLTNNILGSSEHKIDVNPYATEDQKKKALELLEKCNLAIDQEKPPQAKRTKMEYLRKLDDIQANMGDLQELYDTGITLNMKKASSIEYKRWDDMLNEIYSLLKVQLSDNEMVDLKNKQINWINYRDKTAENEANKFEGGSFSGVQYNITLARLTKERCYELVNEYMN